MPLVPQFIKHSVNALLWRKDHRDPWPRVHPSPDVALLTGEIEMEVQAQTAQGYTVLDVLSGVQI